MYDHHSGRRLVPASLFVGLLAVALVATAGVGSAATTASPAHHDLGSSVQAADVEEPDAQLNVTRRYYQTSANDSRVGVQLIVSNPEILDRSDVQSITFNLSDVDYDAVRGFEHVEGDVYRLDPSATTPQITIYNRIKSLSEYETDHFARIVPENVRQCDWSTNSTYVDMQSDQLGVNEDKHTYDCGKEQGSVVSAETAAGTSFDVHNTYESVGPGFVTSGNSREAGLIDEHNVRDEDNHYYPLVLMGDFQTYSRAEQGRNVTLVVPEGVELRESPQNIVDSVAESAVHLEAGNFDGPRYLVATGSGSSPLGYTKSWGARWALVRGGQPAHATQNTWFEEYVHTTDDTPVVTAADAESMKWFHEAYSVWGRHQGTLQSGWGSYDQYRAELEFGTEGHAKKSRDYYYNGPLFLSELDQRIRTGSGGQYSLWEVVRRLRARDSITEDGFVDVVRDVGGNDPATFADRTITEDSTLDDVKFPEGETPEPISLSEYQSTYGDVANVSIRLESIEVVSDRGTVPIRAEEPVPDWPAIALRPNATIHYTFNVSNDGQRSGRFALRARKHVKRPLSVTNAPAVYGQAPGAVGAGASRSVVLEANVSGREKHEISAGPIVPEDYVWEETGVDVENPKFGVTVVPTNDSIDPDRTTIVRQHGPVGAPDNPAIVSDDTEAIVFQADDVAGGGHGPPDYDVFIDRMVTFDSTDRRLATGGDGVATVTDLDLSPGEPVEVRFDGETSSDRYYLLSLEAVDGSIPNDPDGDGEYEDVDGDGSIGHNDVVVFSEHRNDSAITDYVPAYDYDDDGAIDDGDTKALFQEVSRSSL